MADDDVCDSRGPRIGNDGQPRCRFIRDHEGAHSAHPDDGWGAMTWHDYPSPGARPREWAAPWNTPAPQPAPPTEDDTERVERALNALDAVPEWVDEIGTAVRDSDNDVWVLQGTDRWLLADDDGIECTYQELTRRFGPVVRLVPES